VNFRVREITVNHLVQFEVHGQTLVRGGESQSGWNHCALIKSMLSSSTSHPFFYKCVGHPAYKYILGGLPCRRRLKFVSSIFYPKDFEKAVFFLRPIRYIKKFMHPISYPLVKKILFLYAQDALLKAARVLIYSEFHDVSVHRTKVYCGTRRNLNAFSFL